MPKVPFDSVCLRAIENELQPLVGSPAQRWVVLGRAAIGVQIYNGQENWILLSASADYGRVHLLSSRPERREASGFVLDLRKYLTDSVLIAAEQRHMDRILDLQFSTPSGVYVLTAEIMGKHSNLILRDPKDNVVSALKWVGPKLSRRPVLPGKPYVEPFEPQEPFFVTGPDAPNMSPFLKSLIHESGFEEIANRVAERDFGAYAAADGSAYPLPFPNATSTFPTFSAALEAGALQLEIRDDLEKARASLSGQLNRVIEAREVALKDLAQAADTASRAAKIQREAELIQAYATMAEPGTDRLEAWDYDGQPLTLKLLPHLTALENAQRLFDKAKKAKLGSSGVQEQIARLTADLGDLTKLKGELSQATSADEVEDLRETARKRKWLFETGAAKAKEDRPFEGHAVRELVSPSGWTVLYGDNASSNDYLTQKVAKPNDWWLHVRGATSCHVILRTGNQPDKVQRADLEWAAQVCARHSTQKHAQYVPVDYTLKKYVRKPRGSAVGAVVYEREKTLHVDP